MTQGRREFGAVFILAGDAQALLSPFWADEAGVEGIVSHELPFG